MMDNNLFDVHAGKVDHDLVVLVNITDKEADDLEKFIFESDSIPYNGIDQDGNSFEGDLVNVQKIGGKYYLYIKLENVNEL